jgi:hypothetical protein
MTPRRTDTLEHDLFKAKVYSDQVRYMAKMVRGQLPYCFSAELTCVAPSS